MELPKKLKAPEYCTWNKESPEAKINELIDYLESQKEGENEDCLCHLGEPPKKGCIKYKEEPKQIDVEHLMNMYAEYYYDWIKTKDNDERKRADEKMYQILQTVKQALQQ